MEHSHLGLGAFERSVSVTLGGLGQVDGETGTPSLFFPDLPIVRWARAETRLRNLLTLAELAARVLDQPR